MQLYAVVVSHHTAPLPVRERLALPREKQQECLAWWGQEVPEVALLVTCHRTEVYWIDREGSTTRGLSWLAKVAGMDEKDLSPSTLSLLNEAAVRHLFRVAAGLDSRVVGETQILGQVRRSRELASQSGTLGPYLDRLFALALAAGRAARQHLILGSGDHSLVRTAVQVALKNGMEFAGCPILVLGAGGIGQLCIRELRRVGATTMWLSNRSPERLQRVAEAFAVRAIPWDEWPQALSEVEVVFVATAASTPVLRLEHLQGLNHIKLIVDLAMPRNVDPQVAELAQVPVVTVDDLADGAAGSMGFQEQAELVLERAVGRYQRWVRARELAVLIRGAEESLRTLFEQELDRTVAAMRRKPSEWARVRDLAAASMARKVLAPVFTCLEDGRSPLATDFLQLVGSFKSRGA